MMNRKTQKRSGAALLCTLMAAAFVACGETPGTAVPEAEKQTSSVQTDTVTEETEPIDVIGKLKELDFGGETIHIDISVNCEEWNTSSVYVMGADSEVGDEIKDMVYRRNRDIAEQLNLTVAWTEADCNYADVQMHIQKPVLAGDDATDLYINDQLGMIAVMLKGCLTNIADLEGGDCYFDFAADGWYTEYMDKLAIVEGKRYMLTGDYFIDSIRASHAVFFNKNLMTDYFEGPDELYRTVSDGRWTYDAYLGYAKDFYVDVNGDGKRDEDDIYGVRALTNWSPVFFSATDCRTVSWDKDGIPYIDPSVERTAKLSDYIVELFSSPGYYLLSDWRRNAEMFSSGKMLFTVWLKLADMELDAMRNMDGIGLVPYPKLDESQKEYRTLVHDTVEIGAIPVTVKESAIAPLSAYLQAMTQYSAKYIMPMYYETALKIKYTQDEQSAQMLDIIRSGISAPFEFAYSGYTGDIGMNTIASSMQKLTNMVASSIEANRSKAESKLAGLADTISELP